MPQFNITISSLSRNAASLDRTVIIQLKTLNGTLIMTPTPIRLDTGIIGFSVRPSAMELSVQAPRLEFMIILQPVFTNQVNITIKVPPSFDL
jgi:hypothetical protein